MKPLFLYDGQGKTLRQAFAAIGSRLAQPERLEIEVANYSEAFAAHDCLEFNLFIKAASTATGNVLVQISGTHEFLDAETWYTIAFTADIYGNWKSGGLLGGYFRVLNSTDEPITVILQKRLN